MTESGQRQEKIKMILEYPIMLESKEIVKIDKGMSKEYRSQLERCPDLWHQVFAGEIFNNLNTQTNNISLGWLTIE